MQFIKKLITKISKILNISKLILNIFISIKFLHISYTSIEGRQYCRPFFLII